MTSQEEKDRALAEYFAAHGAGDDDDDEADFDPSDDGEESDPFEDDNSDDDDDGDDSEGGNEDEDNCVVLNGTLHLNEEGNRVIYSGIWATKKDFDANQADSDSEHDETKSDSADGNKATKIDEVSKKKKSKFKLKSKQVISSIQTGEVDVSSCKDPFFDLSKPTVTLPRCKQADSNRSHPLPPKRSMLFDGFFFTSEEEGHRKVKERDVELTFFVEDEDCCHALENGKEGADQIETAGQRYRVLGRGTNEFGLFTIEGTYDTRPPQTVDGLKVGENGTDVGGTRYSLLCRKRYRPTDTSSNNRSNDSEDDDEVMSSDEGADVNELIALNEEAHMSVEELRRKYYGSGSGDGKEDEGAGVDSKKPQRKRAREADTEEESDYDGCGF